MSTLAPDTDRNITAFFGSRETAEQAVAHLVETGVPREKILLRTGAARSPGCVENGKGLLQEVKELILPSEEPDAAVEALKHEGFLLSVRPETEAHDAVFQLLEQDGGKGVESREDIWPDWKTGSDRTPAEEESQESEGPDAEASEEPEGMSDAGASSAPTDDSPSPDHDDPAQAAAATTRGEAPAPLSASR